MFDVVIIGAGPAGVAAAITCKRANLKVCVITQPIKEIKKTQVQSVHPGVLTILNDLGLSDSIIYSKTNVFKEIYIDNNANKLSTESDQDWFGFHIERSVFNQILLDKLHQNGIPVYIKKISANDFIFCAEHITVFLGEKELKSRFCIDASGYSRVLKRQIDHQDIKYSYPLFCWSGNSNRNENIDNSKTQFIPRNNGWLWIAPKDQDEFNWTLLTTKKEDSLNFPYKLLETSENYSSHNVQWRLTRPLFDNNIAFCGDAAGLLDPASGQGILNALISGIMLSKSLAKSAKDKDKIKKQIPFLEYDQWFINYFESKVALLVKSYKTFGIKIGTRK